MGPVTRPRIGRRFGKWAIAASVILLLIAGHTAWDLVEARRLLRLLALMTAESSARDQSLERPSNPPWDRSFGEAAPVYLAAATLARYGSRDTARSEINQLLRRDGADLSPEELGRIREFLDRQVDALRLLDRATALEFTRFPPDARAEWTQLRSIEWLCSVRSAYSALAGDAEIAAASIVAELLLDGGPDRPMTPLWPFLLARRTETILNVQRLLRRTKPSEPALARLAEALQDADDDDEWARYFMRERDQEFDADRLPWAYAAAFGQVGLLSAGRPSWFKVWRPLSAREVRRQLEQYAHLIAASRAPWPGRINRVLEMIGPARSTIAEAYVRFLTSSSGWITHPDPERRRRQLHSSALDLAGIRTARVAVAVERYRRANAGEPPSTLAALVPTYLNAIPIDPFSGEPVRYRATGSDYVVYSHGIDGKDDEGAEAEAPPVAAGPTGSDFRLTGDLGLRVPTASPR